MEVVDREDLSLKNHLSGLRRRLVKISFFNVQQLMDVKKQLQQAVQRNRARESSTAIAPVGGSFRW